MDSTFLSFSSSARGTSVMFKSKEYKTATDALQAYILDYEGKQQKYYRKRNKYDKQFVDLFCSNNGSSHQSRKSSTKSGDIKNLVRSAYEKLKKDERETVQRSLTASTQLMEKIEKDRLPSPTRSTILAGRPSTGSVDTDILLDAKVTVSREVNSSGKHSSKQKHRSINIDYNQREGIRNKDVFKQSSSMDINELLTASHEKPPSDLRKLKHNDVSRFTEVTQLNRSVESATSMQYPDLLSLSQLGHIKNKISNGMPNGDFNHSHNNGNNSKRVKGEIGKSQHQQHNISVMKTPEKQIHANCFASGAMEDLNATFQDMNASLKSFNSSLIKGGKNKTNNHGSIPVDNKSFSPSTSKLIGNNSSIINKQNVMSGAGNVIPAVYDERSIGFDSDATSSSIITGHMLKGAVPRKHGLTKVSSTPKRGARTVGPSNTGTKQLRFELETTKSSTGQGVEINNLTEIPPDYGQSISKHNLSIDTLLVEKPPRDKPDFAFGRRDIVGILKGNSPGKTRRAMSRVSFTTDDLLDSDPTGLIAAEQVRPRSKSLPRPLFTGTPPRETIGDHGLRNERISAALPYSSHTNDFHAKAYSSPKLNSSFERRGNHYQDLHNPFVKDLLALNSSGDYISRQLSTSNKGAGRLNNSGNLSLNGSSTGERQSKYKEFLQSLMKEIDDSESSVATIGANTSGYHQNGNALSPGFPKPGVMQQDEGCGFLSRIQNLLASERIPTVSQYLDPEDTHDSLTTEAILEGDRPWEKKHTFKQPTAVEETNNGKPTIFEKFMDDCIQEAQGNQSNTLTGKSQPGSLEALKNMLFTIQGLSTSQDEGAASKTDSNYEAMLYEETDENGPELPLDDSINKLLSPETKKLLSNSYSKQPGGPSLEKAMEHLTKLQGLVEGNAEY